MTLIINVLFGSPRVDPSVNTRRCSIYSYISSYFSLFSLQSCDIVAMLTGLLLAVIAIIVQTHITLGCDRNPHDGVLVVAAGNFLGDSSEQGTNWSPSETKGQNDV